MSKKDNLIKCDKCGRERKYLIARRFGDEIWNLCPSCSAKTEVPKVRRNSHKRR